MIRTPSLIMVTFLLTAVGCSSTGDLTVFAATSLAEAFTEVAAAFEEAHPGVSVTFNFAGSQQLRTQLEHGARADVFASADHRQMDAAIASRLLLGEPVNFASNRLVLIVPTSSSPQPSPVGGEEVDQPVQSLRGLAQEGVKLVLALSEVPVGGYARAAIQRMGADPQFGPSYAERVLASVVSEETNVRHVAQKVALGEADAGIIYLTDATAAYLASRVEVIPIPQRFNVIASYPIAQLKDTRHPELAKEFIRFVQSSQGQEILQKHGFGPASPTSQFSATPLPWGEGIGVRGTSPTVSLFHGGLSQLWR